MSYANSRIPHSAQQEVHDALEKRVCKHAAEAFRKPFAAHSEAAFESAVANWDGKAALILDAGCGVGHSTIALARAWPEHWVIGVDQSQDRLQRRKPYPSALMPRNLVFVRADLVDFWRLLDRAGLRLARHYLLYPNPWPKIGHLGRRWHAHPVFPFIARLGGELEVRSNWKLYIDEFALALHALLGRAASWGEFEAPTPLSPFERKYRDSAQTLYRLHIDLGAGGVPALTRPGAVAAGTEE